MLRDREATSWTPRSVMVTCRDEYPQKAERPRQPTDSIITHLCVAYLIVQHRHSLLCQDWVRERRQNLQQRINKARMESLGYKHRQIERERYNISPKQSSKCSFLPLSLPNQPACLRNEKMIVISVFSQRESRVKRPHWRGASCTAGRCAITPAKCQQEQQNPEDMVASSEGKGEA